MKKPSDSKNPPNFLSEVCPAEKNSIDAMDQFISFAADISKQQEAPSSGIKVASLECLSEQQDSQIRPSKLSKPKRKSGLKICPTSKHEAAPVVTLKGTD